MFPLAGVWISRYTSIVTCIALSTLVCWLGAHQCKISWKLHLNTSNTDLQTMMQNIDKFAARQTRPILTNTRSSRNIHQRCSLRKGVLINFAIFTRKHLCQSLFFNEVTGLCPATLLKKRLWHRCFPVNFAKFLRTLFFYRAPLGNCFWSSRSHMFYKVGVLKNLAKFTEKHLCCSLFSNRPATLWKKRLHHSSFPMNFSENLRIPFLQNTSGRLASEYRNICQEHLKVH